MSKREFLKELIQEACFGENGFQLKYNNGEEVSDPAEAITSVILQKDNSFAVVRECDIMR